MKFEIRNRPTGNVQFTAEINCDENAANSIKIGLAVEWAVRTGARLELANLEGAYIAGANLGGTNLVGANLTRARLEYANLAGTNLAGTNLEGACIAGANIIHGGIRSDGHSFYAHTRNGGELWIKAGCRYFEISEARKYWNETRGGTPLGDETTSILDNLEQLAAIRGLIEKKAEAA